MLLRSKVVRTVLCAERSLEEFRNASKTPKSVWACHLMLTLLCALVPHRGLPRQASPYGQHASQCWLSRCAPIVRTTLQALHPTILPVSDARASVPLGFMAVMLLRKVRVTLSPSKWQVSVSLCGVS